MLVRHSALYLGSNLFVAALGFASAAAFTRLYAPDDYGVYVLACSVGSVLASVCFSWIRLSVLRFQSEGDDADVRTAALAGYLASVPVAAVAVPVLLLFLPWEVAVGGVLFATTVSLFDLHSLVLQAGLKVRAYTLVTVLRAAAFVGLGLGLHAMGVERFGLVLALSLAYVISSVVVTSTVWAAPRARFSPETVRKLLRFGGPATVSAIVFSLHGTTDRFTAVAILGQATGGEYGAVADLTRQMILIPAMAIGGAIVPIAVRRYATEGPEAARGHLVHSAELLLALLLPTVVGLALIGGDLSRLLLGSEFRETGVQLMPILAFVWLFAALTQIYVHVSFHLAAMPSRMIAQAGLALVANVAIAIPATYAYGIRGTAFAAVTAEAIGMVGGFFLARTAFPLPIDLPTIRRPVAATAVMVGAVLAARTLGPGSGVARVALVLAAGGLAYVAAALAFDVLGSRAILRRGLRRADRDDSTGGARAEELDVVLPVGTIELSEPTEWIDPLRSGPAPGSDAGS